MIILITFVAATLAALAAAPPPNDLHPFGVDQDRLAGAPDFSFLNHPIGASDRTLFVTVISIASTRT